MLTEDFITSDAPCQKRVALSMGLSGLDEIYDVAISM